MGKNIDKANIQVRNINTGKGPAVQALRAQADKYEYRRGNAENFIIREELGILMAEVVDIEVENQQVRRQLLNRTVQDIKCRAVILTTELI